MYNRCKLPRLSVMVGEEEVEPVKRTEYDNGTWIRNSQSQKLSEREENRSCRESTAKQEKEEGGNSTIGWKERGKQKMKIQTKNLILSLANLLVPLCRRNCSAISWEYCLFITFFPRNIHRSVFQHWCAFHIRNFSILIVLSNHIRVLKGIFDLCLVKHMSSFANQFQLQMARNLKQTASFELLFNLPPETITNHCMKEDFNYLLSVT